MAIVVTGGLGVNGAPVLRALVSAGHRPVVIDTRNDLSLVDPATRDAIEVVVGDFTDEHLSGPIMRRGDVDCVVHLAAVVGSAQEMSLEACRVNTWGTAFLIDLAARCGVRRFVYTSTRGVYGEQVGERAHPTYRAIREDDPARPFGVYDVTKFAAEGMCRNIARQRGIEFVALRFATIFGPGKTLRHKNYGVLSTLIEDGLAGRAVDVPQGGDQKDDLIYVEDVADAIVRVTARQRLGHDVYNIASGVGVTLRDLADAVTHVQPAARITIGPGLNYMGWPVNYSGVLDPSRAFEDLGYRPRFSLKEAVADYARRLADIASPASDEM
jgi:UDP-glucose 4-epimerase